MLCEDKIVNFFLTVKGSVSLSLFNNKKIFLGVKVGWKKEQNI